MCRKLLSTMNVLKELLLYNPIEAFFEISKIFIRSGECIMWGSVQVLRNQVSKKSFYTFENIDLRESHVKVHENRVKLWELIQF